MFSKELFASPQFLAVIAVSICSSISGFSAGYTGTAVHSMELDSALVMDQTENSWVVSIMSVGGCFGSAVGGPLIDFFGRRLTILGTGFPFIMAYLMIGFADRVSMIVIGRFISGLCVGINSTAIPVFLGEILDANIRGTLGIFPTAMGNGGILIAYLAGTFLNWRELAYLGAFLSVPYILLLLLISESPRYYASKLRHADALAALKWYRGPNVDVGAEFNEVLTSSDPVQMNPEHGVFREFMKKSNFRPVSIILILMTIQQCSGVNAIISYIVNIFEKAEIPVSSHTSAILFGVVNFLAVFMAIPLIDKKGRKVLLYISDLFMIWTLLLLGAYFWLKENNYYVVEYLHWMPILSIVLYIMGFSFGFGPVPWLMMGEILPLSIRGFAAGFLSSYNWACASIVQKLFLFMLATLNESGTFWLFGGFCVAGFYMIVLVPETKGKSLEIIEAELMNDTEGEGFMKTFDL